MDALTRHWKRLKENPSQLFLLGTVLVVALLTWFVLAVRKYKQQRDHRAMWSQLAEKRQDPGQAFYISQDEMQMIRMMARQRAAQAKRMAELQGSRDPRNNPDMAWQRAFNDTLNAEMMRRLYTGVPRVYLGDASAEESNPLRKPDLARPTDKVVEELESLAGLHTEKPIAPWLYFHVGNLRFARGHDSTSTTDAHAEFERAIAHYAEAKRLLASTPAGHVLTDPQFNWLETSIARAKAQQQWVAKLEKRRKAAARSQGDDKNNPVLEVKTNKGLLKIELYLSESPALVNALCKLVDSGYYDGRPVYGSPDRVNFGSPFDNGGSTELGPGLRARILERTHTKGSVSMDTHVLLTSGGGDKASTSKVMILKSDPSLGSQSLGGMWNRFDGTYSIVGQVILGDARRAELKDKPYAELARIARAGGLDPSALLAEAILEGERSTIEREALDARRKELDKKKKDELVAILVESRRDSLREQHGEDGLTKAIADATEALGTRKAVSLIEEIIKSEKLDRVTEAIEAREKALSKLADPALAKAATAAGITPVERLVDAILKGEDEALQGLGDGDRIVSVRFLSRGGYKGKVVDWDAIGKPVK